jgi:GntR family transcriptional regulator, arabinose operon transcriptional repressor
MSGSKESYRYEQIARTLQRNIKRGLFPSGKLPPERFLAEYFSVNRLTLRKAMKLLEVEKWIFRMGRRGTFIVKGDQFGGITKRRVFAYVLAGEDDFSSFYSNSFTELSRRLVAVGGSLLFYAVKNLDELKPLEEATMGHGVDGIFISGKMDVGMIEKIRSWEAPLVVLGHLMYRDSLEDELDQVIVDSLDYSYRCTKMLIEQGAKDIALVNGPSYQIFSDSTQGYMKALNEAGIAFDEKKVLNCAEDNALFAEKTFGKWLKDQDIDAVFVAGEKLQAGVRQALWNTKRVDIKLASITYASLKSSKNCLLLNISANKIAFEAVELIGKKLANAKKEAETIKILAK